MAKLLDENSLLAIKQYVGNHATYLHTIEDGYSEVVLRVWWVGGSQAYPGADAQGGILDLLNALEEGKAIFQSCYIEATNKTYYCLNSIEYGNNNLHLVLDNGDVDAYLYAQGIDDYGDWDVEML